MAIRTVFLDGQKFGMLTVLGEAKSRAVGTKGYSVRYWKCQCDCGNICERSHSNLTRKIPQSCGCSLEQHRHKFGKRNLTHGLYGSDEYKVWSGMIRRCTNTHEKHYADYGGRGIEVCDRWRYSFENFFADMGNRPSKKHSIERMENNKGYSPDNCRWATQMEQGINKRNNVLITLSGITLTQSQWTRILDMTHGGISYLLKRKPIEFLEQKFSSQISNYLKATA